MALKMRWLAMSLLAVSVQASFLDVRDECANFTTLNGLDFEVHCPAQIPTNWTYIHPSTIQNSIRNCMDLCSITEHCWSVVFNATGGTCWMSTDEFATATDFETSTEEGMQSGWAIAADISGYDATCPFADESVQTLANSSAQFDIYCDAQLYGADSYPWDVPQYEYPYHAETLEDCMEQCLNTRPFCYGVTWNPDYLQYGWSNCWPKMSANYTLAEQSSTSEGVFHAAALTNYELANTTCSDGDVTVNGTTFETKCNYVTERVANTTIHAESLTDCLSGCAGNSSTCVGIIFDSTMVNGYRNCYMLSQDGILSASDGFYYANITARSASSGSSSGSSSTGDATGTGSSSSSSSSKSMAWIAGPVIGGVAVVGGIIFALWYVRRRRRNKTKRAVAAEATRKDERNQKEVVEGGDKDDKKKALHSEQPIEPSPQYTGPHSGQIQGQMAVARYPAEMAGWEPKELDAPPVRFEME